MPHNLREAPSGAILISDSYRLQDLASGVHHETPSLNISGAVSTLDFSGKSVVIFTVVGDLSGSFTFPPLNIPTMPLNYTRAVLVVEFVQDSTGNRLIPLDTLFANAASRDGIPAVNPAAGSKTRVKIIIERTGGPTIYRVEYVPYHTHDFELSDVSDFVITSPVADEWLKYNGSAWVNAPLPAGQVPTGYAVVNSLTALRALTPGSVPVIVTGHTSAWDGGGGIFYWSAADNSKMASSVTIAAGGTGYTAGTVATVAATASNLTLLRNRAVVHIDTVDGSGAVTAVTLVKWGLYTTATASNPVPTTHGWGTGLTLNITWANCDNGGTIVSPAGTSDGRWIRDFTGPANVKWFGAGLGANSQPEIQKAVAYHRAVYIPEGTYVLYSSIVLFDESRLSGDGPWLTLLYGSTNNIGKPLIKTNIQLTLSQMNASAERKVVIEKLALQGYCTSAINMVRGTYSLVDQVRVHNLFCTTHAVVCEDCWDTKLTNMLFVAVSEPATSYTPPSNIACLYIGRFSNAFAVDNMMTSGQTDYGILIEAQTGMGSSQNLTNLTLQGHNNVGLYIRDNGTGPTNIQSIFTESCKVSIRLGDKAASRSARGVNITGGWLATSSVAQAGVAVVYMDLVYGCTFSGCTFSSGNNIDNCIFLFNDASYVRFHGMYIGFMQSIINYCRRTSTTANPEVAYFDQFTTDGSMTQSLLLMKSASTTRGTWGRAFIDANGNWSTTLMPVIPVHSSFV